MVLQDNHSWNYRDQTNPATGMYSLSGPALPWFAALNVPSPSFVIDFGCVFRLVGAVIGRVLSSSMSEDRLNLLNCQ